MMLSSQLYAISASLSIILVCSIQYVVGDFEFMVSQPESLTVMQSFDTLLSCEMNIEPDKFQWKFYPTNDPFNTKAYIDLNTATYRLLPENEYTVSRNKSQLIIQVKSTNVTGDYQCLAYYGASVVASVPWRVTIARLGKLPPQKSVAVSVQSGNTVSWRCDSPESNPEAFFYYNKGKTDLTVPIKDAQIKSLILTNVSAHDSGTYGCDATNGFYTNPSQATLKLEVLNHGPAKAPSFIIEPLKEYTAIKGSTAFLECCAVGKPIPKVSWSKKHSVLPSRAEILPGGLLIRDISQKDEGVYECNHSNDYGTLSRQIVLKYNEEPSITCNANKTDCKQGENITDISCEVKGIPKPEISWFINGFSVHNDSNIETAGTKIYFRPVEKRHAGNLQIFARNVVKTVYSTIRISVIPLSTSISELGTPMVSQHRHNNHRKHKKKPSKSKSPKMIPPSRPIIARVNDETVVVRWNVSENSGLPIQFFKVQYKDLGHNGSGKGTGWNTANNDISPNIRAFDVPDLTPEHVYKFRVAAVYSNDDSKMSNVSKRFYLKRWDFDDKNPLPVCLITNVETISQTAIQIYWTCPESSETIDGFYIGYMTATRAGDDYMKTTVDGGSTRSYVINYLQPGTSYDIKLQSFNSKLAGEYSPVMKGKTDVAVPVHPVTPPVITTSTTSNSINSNSKSTTADSSLYIIIAAGVIAVALAVTGLVLLFVCRKWKKKKLTDNPDKTNVDHHIQSDNNDYVVEPKAIPRTNGCAIPGNKITITSNPLADADKNPNVIEMRNVVNNNVRPEPVTSPSQSEGHSKGPTVSKEKNRNKRHTNRAVGENSSTGSNYV